MFKKQCPACGKSLPLTSLIIGKNRYIQCPACKTPMRVRRGLAHLISVPAAIGCVVGGFYLWNWSDWLALHLGRDVGNILFVGLWAGSALFVQIAAYWLLASVEPVQKSIFGP